MQEVICMKWGTRYGSEYVNKIYGMVMRNTNRPTRLTCFTDDTTGIRPEVNCLPLPEIELRDDIAWTPWRKLALWQKDLGGLSGDVLFLDLDLIITGNIDCFFDFQPGKYCVIENWTQMGQNIGNTSAFRFPVGKYTHIYDELKTRQDEIVKKYVIEQIYISREIDEMYFWPAEWCVSFKHSLLPKWPMNFFKVAQLRPENRVIAFTGKPDPDEAAIGVWPVKSPIKKIYKHVLPTPWINEHWRE